MRTGVQRLGTVGLVLLIAILIVLWTKNTRQHRRTQATVEEPRPQEPTKRNGSTPNVAAITAHTRTGRLLVSAPFSTNSQQNQSVSPGELPPSSPTETDMPARSSNDLTASCPIVGDDFQISAELMTFMKLSEEQRVQLRNIGTQELFRVQEWERTNANIVEEEPGKLLTYRLPASKAFAQDLGSNIEREVTTVVGEDNYAVLKTHFDTLVKQLENDRLVTCYTEPNAQEGGFAYLFSVDWQEQETGESKGFDENGPALKEIPSRWYHLFGISNQTNDNVEHPAD